MNLFKTLLISLALIIPASHALSAQDAKPEVQPVDTSTIRYERNKTCLKFGIDACLVLLLAGISILWGTEVYQNSNNILHNSQKLSDTFMPILFGKSSPSGIIPYILSNGLAYSALRLHWPTIKNRFYWAFATNEQWQERLEKEEKFKSDLEKFKKITQERKK